MKCSRRLRDEISTHQVVILNINNTAFALPPKTEEEEGNNYKLTATCMLLRLVLGGTPSSFPCPSFLIILTRPKAAVGDPEKTTVTTTCWRRTRRHVKQANNP
jgi:hypothetical protein